MRQGSLNTVQDKCTRSSKNEKIITLHILLSKYSVLAVFLGPFISVEEDRMRGDKMSK